MVKIGSKLVHVVVECPLMQAFLHRTQFLNTFCSGIYRAGFKEGVMVFSMESMIVFKSGFNILCSYTLIICSLYS